MYIRNVLCLSLSFVLLIAAGCAADRPVSVSGEGCLDSTGVRFGIEVELGPCIFELPPGYKQCRQFVFNGYIVCEYCNPDTDDRYVSIGCDECFRRVLSATPTDMPIRMTGVEGIEKLELLPCDLPFDIEGELDASWDLSEASVSLPVDQAWRLPNAPAGISYFIDGRLVSVGEMGTAGIAPARTVLQIVGNPFDIAKTLYLMGVDHATFETDLGEWEIRSNDEFGLVETWWNGEFLRVDPVEHTE